MLNAMEASGLIEKPNGESNFKTTPEGDRWGGVTKQKKRNGQPIDEWKTEWPRSILNNPNLRSALNLNH